MSDDSLRDIQAGGALARGLLYALADGDENGALLLINGADAGIVRWAAGFLASCVRETTLSAVKGDERRLELAMKAGADALVNEDVLTTELALLVQRYYRGEGNG